MAFLPPRPKAIATLLTSDDFLPGAQALLFSLKKTLQNNHRNKKGDGDTPKNYQEEYYPPEVIVLVTPNVSEATRSALHPTFCTRIVPVDPIPWGASGQDKSQPHAHVESWNSDSYGLTKLHIFGLDVYDTILYIDADCVVLKDVSNLLHISPGNNNNGNKGLVAACPDIFPPDKFNAGVLVVRPSRDVFQQLLERRNELSSYDGGDTGYLNAFFSNWYSSMPASARLPFGCNAQRFMHNCTYDKQPNYWNMGIEELTIVHYSSSPKPWETSTIINSTVGSVDHVQDHLSETDAMILKKIHPQKKNTKVQDLWNHWYQQSQAYATRKQSEPKRKHIETKRPNIQDPKQLDKLVRARYKELRKEHNCSVMDAMEMARREYGVSQADDANPAKQVAAMFGL